MLTVTTLEDRSAAVSLLFDWRFAGDWADEPFRLEVEAAASAMAARLEVPGGLAAVGGFTALTPWGEVEVTGVPADTWAVWVGPTTDPASLGEGGPVSYGRPGPPFDRSPGMTLAFGPAVDWTRFVVTATAEHELLHGAGVMGHTANPTGDTLSPFLAPHEDPPLTAADVALIESYGLRVPGGPDRPPTLAEVFRSADPTARVVAIDPWGHTGYARLSPQSAAVWAEAGTLGRWRWDTPGLPYLY